MHARLFLVLSSPRRHVFPSVSRPCGIRNPAALEGAGHKSRSTPIFYMVCRSAGRSKVVFEGAGAGYGRTRHGRDGPLNGCDWPQCSASEMLGELEPLSLIIGRL